MRMYLIEVNDYNCKVSCLHPDGMVNETYTTLRPDMAVQLINKHDPGALVLVSDITDADIMNAANGVYRV
jgi:hypothetical protein